MICRISSPKIHFPETLLPGNRYSSFNTTRYACTCRILCSSCINKSCSGYPHEKCSHTRMVVWKTLLKKMSTFTGTAHFEYPRRISSFSAMTLNKSLLKVPHLLHLFVGLNAEGLLTSSQCSFPSEFL